MANILLIETDPEQRSTIKNSLISDGHHVWSVGSGRQGLAIFSQHHAETVILDMLVPDNSGIHIIKDLARRGFDKSSIIAIAHHNEWISSHYILEIARKFGIKHTLEKPFTSQELLQCIATTLTHSTATNHDYRD